jgi:glutathione synthase/RimK-type ligase-like ATP-grasp enzyme
MNNLKNLSSADSISEKQVLILTRRFDPEAARVSIKLLAKGIDSVRVNVEDIADDMKVRYKINDISGPKCEFTVGNRSINTSNFPVIWLRDFDSTIINFNIGENYDKFTQRFCFEQWNDSLQILKDSLKSEWINRPESNLYASNRLRQLSLARDVGLKIPSTIITNDPEAAGEFYQDHNGRVVMKAVHHHGVEVEGKIYSMYTRTLTEECLAKIDDLIYAPCILQERLEKKSELRVTVVGNIIFAAELETRSLSNNYDDLHRFPIAEIPKKAVNLDKMLEDCCLKMMKSLGLRYGAFDFIIDMNNQAHFLEINLTGDWYWIEHETKLPITDAMVNLMYALTKDHDSSAF